MHFERSLQRTIYAPWRDQYIDYQKLKQLLRDSGSDAGTSNLQTGDDDPWTEDDETAFVEELVNVQLEKVHSFQNHTLQDLRDRTSAAEAKLDPVLEKTDGGEADTGSGTKVVDGGKATLQEVLKELDGITGEMNELEKYSRINFTGFLKAAKKHDRKRGHSYRVRPLTQVRLAALPFNKEDYSPLLYRLSTMYALVRSHLEGGKGPTATEAAPAGARFQSYKFWVHPEDLLELKTVILRRLPVLVYNPQTSKLADVIQGDPTITSIYFDNPKFPLYSGKVDHTHDASSLRVRWYDQLSDHPEIYCEKKTVYADDTSSEQKLTMKTKHVQGFLNGDYKMDKDVARAKERFGEESEQAKELEATVRDIQSFIKDKELQPMLRANYTRTAFQIPGDSRVRITLDTDLALIREDALDADRPCRDPEDWHRRDIDDDEMEWPFEKVRKGEINRFPYAVLEIRVSKAAQSPEWVQELMNSHLVKETPRFSKFAHGVAQLFDDFVNSFPFWLSEVDTDIRKDPQQAFDEEQARRAQVAQDEIAVGSLLNKASPHFRQSISSPVGSPRPSGPHSAKSQSALGKATADMTRRPSSQKPPANGGTVNVVEEDDEVEDYVASGERAGFRSYLPTLTKYARRKAKLPPGVVEPSFWIKDEGPVKIEAKVWLANQRTYIKWQHVSVLLASLSLGLYNAAGKDNQVAQILGLVYTIIAIFIAFWGYGLYLYRGSLIRKRSGKDLDFVFGPVIVCIGLIVALLLNFAFRYQALKKDERQRSPWGPSPNSTTAAGWEEL